MLQPTYKKGHMLVWIGFIGLFVGNGIKIAADQATLGSLVTLACFILFIYGNLLVLKAKNRSWAWIILAFIPPVLGAVFIFMLKDQSPQTTPTPVTIPIK